MNSLTSWQKYKNNLYSNEALGFYLDLSDTGITETDRSNVVPLFNKALEAMGALDKGAIANPDENRQVGHYWLRDPGLAPSSEIRTQIEETVESIISFSKQIHQGTILTPSGEPFTNILLIGIGGSALGPQFIADALGTSDGLSIDFLDNTDPDGIDHTLNSISGLLSQTLVIVISKSGGTAETRNGMLETQEFFSRHNLDFPKQSVAITGEGSQLYKTSINEKWLSIFPMWDWVGGRTSIMSAVGLLPAALLGVDINALLSGAKVMDQLTREKGINDNPAALLALSWYIIGEGKGNKDMVLLPYRDRLILFSRYLQQLIMESIGKELDLDGKIVQQGIAVYGNKGSTDQHAYVQQLRDGLDNFFVTFIEVLSERQGQSILVDNDNTSGEYLFGFFKGTQTALKQNNRRSLTITIEDLTPSTVGALIALYERAVGFYASFVNINAYHQPGVEAGKKAAGKVLETKNRITDLLSEVDQALSIEDIISRLNLQGEEVLVYHILRHYAANHSLNVQGSFYDPENLKVSKS